MSAVKCGTYSGYSTHKKNGSQVCEPCRQAQRDYMRDWRARKPQKMRADGRRAKIRARALTRLAELYPFDYDELLAAEWGRETDGAA